MVESKGTGASFVQTRRILIVEDHAILRDGLCAMLSDYSEFKVAGEAADGLEGVRQARALQPDLVLLDLSMPKMNGIDALKEIKKINPQIKALVLSAHRSQNQCQAAMQAGADGYMLKDAGQDDFILGIQAVLKGEKFISRELRGGVADGEDADHGKSVLKSDLLTSRERQVLKLVVEGYKNKEIGEMLFISAKTVDNHRSNLMRKLEVHSAQELTRYAARESLLEED